MQEALVGAKPPHLMAFSKHFDSAARTLDKTQESFKNGAKVARISNKHPYPPQDSSITIRSKKIMQQITNSQKQ